MPELSTLSLKIVEALEFKNHSTIVQVSTLWTKMPSVLPIQIFTMHAGDISLQNILH